MTVKSTARDAPTAMMPSDALAGDPVVNRQDAMLGVIEDLLIDVERGTVAYAVLGPDELGIGGKSIAIPWGALTLDVDRQCFILDADKRRLEKAPGFDREGSATGDLSWAHDVHHYYGVRPYWQEAPGT